MGSCCCWAFGVGRCWIRTPEVTRASHVRMTFLCMSLSDTAPKKSFAKLRSATSVAATSSENHALTRWSRSGQSMSSLRTRSRNTVTSHVTNLPVGSRFR